MEPRVTVDEIVEFLGEVVLAILGPADRVVTRVRAITEADSDEDLSFCDRDGPEAIDLIAGTHAGAVICGRAAAELAADHARGTLIVTDNPRLAFARVFRAWFDAPLPEPGIHATAYVSESAQLGPGVYVGPFCYVAPDVSIGEGSVLWGHVHVCQGVTMGKNVLVQPGVVLGADGFGYEPVGDGSWVKWPHVGTVVIEDDVEIGAGSCVDRGTLGETRIGAEAKIGNLTHVAHNVLVGARAKVVNHVTLSGSCSIGPDTWIASHACILHRVRVGSRATVGMCALVREDVPDGATVAGVPARILPESKGYPPPPPQPGTDTC